MPAVSVSARHQLHRPKRPVLKDQFEWSQAALLQGEQMLGIMTDYTEAEIKEDLKSNIELYAYSGKDTTAQD